MDEPERRVTGGQAGVGGQVARHTAPADAAQTAAPEERPEAGPGPHAGIEPPATPKPERAEESTPTPETQATADKHAAVADGDEDPGLNSRDW